MLEPKSAMMWIGLVMMATLGACADSAVPSRHGPEPPDAEPLAPTVSNRAPDEPPPQPASPRDSQPPTPPSASAGGTAPAFVPPPRDDECGLIRFDASPLDDDDAGAPDVPACAFRVQPPSEFPDQLLMRVARGAQGHTWIPQAEGWTVLDDGSLAVLNPDLCEQARNGEFDIIGFYYGCPRSDR